MLAEILNFQGTNPILGMGSFSNIEERVKGKMVPIWEKYMLTVDEAVQYFGIGEKKIRMLISENTDTDYCFTVQVGNKSLINRHKFEEFLNQTTSL